MYVIHVPACSNPSFKVPQIASKATLEHAVI